MNVLHAVNGGDQKELQGMTQWAMHKEGEAAYTGSELDIRCS